jgi:hypothetical protein
MNRQAFVNLAVQNIDKSREFFGKLGFEFDPAFSNAGCACMIVSPGTSVMMLAEGFFQGFTTKDILDTRDSTEVVIALSAGSREGADAMLHAAADAGGTLTREGRDHGHMYGGAFEDLDNHLWEIFHMEGATP